VPDWLWLADCLPGSALLCLAGFRLEQKRKEQFNKKLRNN
jgi:hypothetical protein